MSGGEWSTLGMTVREAGALRRELAGHERARGKRYALGVRERVIAYAEERRAAGAAWLAIATELGLKFETVRRWCIAARPKHGLALRAVEIVPERATDTLAVVSPSGFRVEGVRFDVAVALLRALG